MVAETWLILQLRDTVDNQNYHEIESAINDTFGEAVDRFIPIYHEHVGTYESTEVFLEGYLFVKDCSEVRSKLSGIREQSVFAPLVFNGSFQTVKAVEIRGLKKRLRASIKKQFRVDSIVYIEEGTFKNLFGRVIELTEGGVMVTVEIKRLSRTIVAPMPSTCVRLATKEEETDFDIAH